MSHRRKGRRSREVALHLGRTVGMVVGLAVVVLSLALLVPFPWGLAVALVPVVAFVIASGRMHAHWAPVADELARFPWTDGGGSALETVVERAKVDAATWGGLHAVKSRTLRLSSYQGGRRRRRVVVGDDARWLGRHGGRLWFLVRDGYHSRKTGLLGYDIQTLDVTFHQPGTEVAAGPRRGGEGGTFSLDTPSGRVRVDLGRGEVIPNPPD